MDEDDLRGALRATMTITPPPPMESATIIAAGHRTVRRRAAWAATGLTAVLVAATTLAVGAGLHRDASPPWPVAGPATVSSPPAVDDQAHLARNRELTSLLEQVVPAGWQAAADQSLPNQVGAAPATDGSGISWRYIAAVSVGKHGRTGQLLIQVFTPGNGRPADLCELASGYVGSFPPPCSLVPVGPVHVAVLGPAASGLSDQVAAYRYPDGTVVFLTQSREAKFGGIDRKPLTALPLTKTELAAIAADPRFHLS